MAEVIARRRPLRAIGATALMTMVLLSLIAPWSIRNTRLFDQFVLISTNGGANTWMGNNPSTSGFYQPLPELDIANEAERDAELGRRAKAYIMDQPGAFVKRSAVKLARLHERETIGVVWNKPGLERRFSASVLMPLKAISTGYWLLMLAAGLAGAALLIVRRGLISGLGNIAVLTWGYFAFVHAVTVIQDRYHFASIPFIAALAALLGVAIVDRMRGRHDTETTTQMPEP